MNIFDSPFYTLGATPRDNRRALASKMDEKALLLGDVASNAYSTLTNPAKRLFAEFEWFPGLSADDVTQVIDYLQNLRVDPTADDFALAGTNPLAELEIAFAKLQILRPNSALEAKRAVLELSRLYSSVDLDRVLDDINSCRETAGFPLLQGTQELEDELRRFRAGIKEQLVLVFDSFTEKEYISAITMVTEKYASEDPRYRDSVIIEDLADAYSLKMATKIQQGKAAIIEKTRNIKQGILVLHIKTVTTELAEEIEAWDALVQPLQYVTQEQGQRQHDSEEIVRAVRDLCIIMHNDHQMTDEALFLTKVLNKCFSELLQVKDRLTDDQEALEQLQSEKTILAKMDAVKKVADNVMQCPTLGNVSELKEQTVQLDGIIKHSSLKPDDKVKTRVTLCHMVRNAAIELYNTKHLTDFAYSIINALYEEFRDVSSLEQILAEDRTRAVMFSGNARTASRTTRAYTPRSTTTYTTTSKSQNKPHYVAIIVVLVIVIGIVIANLGSGGSKTPKSTPKPSTPVQTTKPSVNIYPVATKPPESFATYSKREQLKTKMDALKSDIENMESTLQGLADDLQYYEDQYYATYDEDYIDLYNETVEEYNYLWEEYDQAINDYNAMVEEYNNLL